MLSNIHGIMNMITNAIVISNDKCRYEAVPSNILKGFYFS